ncbi:MAG: hydrogenase expression/formation protein HypE [Anaerolineaceae bacterium]|jgi:hydrogenase expression/formation protein HypE
MSGLPSLQGPVCPLPINNHAQIVIGHGSGGIMTHALIRDVFKKHLGNDVLNAGNDAALIDVAEQLQEGQRLVVSMDAHIVSPLFFPGGDIGRLSVCGTVNDVAMMGADVKSLTASFILEEGLLLSELESIVISMAQACEEAGVRIVAADTKVVEKGAADKLFISTTGIGYAPTQRVIAGDRARKGDAVLVSGSLGNHGIAVAQARGNLGFQSSVISDCAPLNHMIAELLKEVPVVHVLRDPTRGGLATTLVEIANQSEVTIELEEKNIPVDPVVRTACELLGLDPLYLANEGKVIIILPQAHAEKALEILRHQPYGLQAALIGQVKEQGSPRLVLRTPFGTTRVLEMLASEMLPRIC